MEFFSDLADFSVEPDEIFRMLLFWWCRSAAWGLLKSWQGAPTLKLTPATLSTTMTGRPGLWRPAACRSMECEDELWLFVPLVFRESAPEVQAVLSLWKCFSPDPGESV